MKVSVIIPTIKGREQHLERCLRAYQETAPANVETGIIVEHDHPHCGAAWAVGADQATGDYLHFSADDLVPHEGWFEAAKKVADEGKLPCPLIYGPDGSVESCGTWGQLMPDGTETDIARVPFLTREMWDQGNWILDAHYWTDNYVWWRGQQLGIPTVVATDYVFTHHWASEGRLETIDEDRQRFAAATG